MRDLSQMFDTAFNQRMIVDGVTSKEFEALNKVAPGFWCHDTAVIDEPCTVGQGTKIWHFTHIMPGAHIGENCMLGQGCFVGGRVHIGDRTRIQNNVSVYDGVMIGEDVFVGPSVVFTNVKFPRVETRIESDGLALKPNMVITHIKRGATIGANATILPGLTIGEYAMVGAGAVVTEDVEAHVLVVGNPAKHMYVINKEGERIATNWLY